ncbi:MAG: zf-TFIIB domain-containing protein [Acidobacteria bacterium]|nr:zf-TFIIB domain-containing protein [Acidobacteriota bacterium]
MTAGLATLRCPSCGAPAAPEATRCDYCRSRLATVSCPSCFGLLFEGAAFCHHCGTPGSRTERAPEQRILCPACRAAMRWVTVGTTDLLECEACDGTWIEAGAFERLCADRENQTAVLHAPASPPRTVVARASAVRYRPCPRCGKLMNRINFGRMSGTIVDVCRGHGTFLDRGELHQVVRFIQEGGLDRAREAQRQDLADERRRERVIARTQAGTDGTSSASTWNESAVTDLLAALLGRH